MKKELSFALNYALNKGFQIHPDAFKILENVDVKKLEKIIKEIVREKTRQKLFQINQDDLETYLGIKEDLTLQNEIKVISEPTNKITSGEGVKGYNALFSTWKGIWVSHSWMSLHLRSHWAARSRYRASSARILA